MSITLSSQGQTMSHLSGVRAIMKDIIETLQQGDRDFVNLSAGNPVIIPEVEQLWRDCTTELLASPSFGEVVGRYGNSRGYEPFIAALVEDFNKRYGLQLTNKNILVTPGSQSLYFFAMNAFGGSTQAGQMKEVLLPLCPDYTGYGGVSLTPQSVRAIKPNLEIDEATHRFKYRPNLDLIKLNETVGCIVFSRPCNPTGNIVTDSEVQEIVRKARPLQIPVFIDSAYAPPFPALNFTDMAPVFDEGIIHCISFSKTGLPGERIGVAIGAAEVIAALESFQTNACIHSSRYGQAIATLALQSGRLVEIADSIIRPHYAEKFQVIEEVLDAELDNSLPWYLHKGEGGIFGWLWFNELPISDWDLYRVLKQAGLIVVPGSPFFPGLQEEWSHKYQCLRVSLTATKEELRKGMTILSQEVQKVYGSA